MEKSLSRDKTLRCVFCYVGSLMVETTGALGREPEPYIVIFDCESDSAFESLPGLGRDEKIKFMQFTVIVAISIPVYLIRTKAEASTVIEMSTRHIWWRDAPDHGCNPIASLLSLFDGAQGIVGYNCLGFDFPLIKRFYNMKMQASLHPEQRYLNHRSKTFDIMFAVRDATDRHFKLDDLLMRNGIGAKSSDGKQAIHMWERGDRGMLQSYCYDDVVLTTKLALLDRIQISDHLVVEMQRPQWFC